MLWKCCTQYASKSGKLSSGHRTGKGQFSFQSQRKAMPKNVQTTTQLHSFHTLAKQFSKLSKLGFNSTWSDNSQMLKMDLEKADKPEIKLPTSTGSQKKQEDSRKTSIYSSLTAKAFDSVNPNKLMKTFQEMGIPDHHTSLLRNLYTGQEAKIRTMDWFQIGKGVHQGCIFLPCLFNLCAEYIKGNAWLN